RPTGDVRFPRRDHGRFAATNRRGAGGAGKDTRRSDDHHSAASFTGGVKAFRGAGAERIVDRNTKIRIMNTIYFVRSGGVHTQKELISCSNLNPVSPHQSEHLLYLYAFLSDSAVLTLYLLWNVYDFRA